MTQTTQEIETGIVTSTEKESTRHRESEDSATSRTGAGIAVIETTETTRETEIKTASVTEIGPEIVTGTVADRDKQYTLTQWTSK